MPPQIDQQPIPDLSQYGDPDLSVEIIFQYFKQLERNRLEVLYQIHVAPMLDILSKGVEFRRVYLGRVFEQWRTSRVDGLRKLLANPSTNELGATLFDEYRVFLTNRAGDEIVPFMEQMWLLHHILSNVYGIPVQKLETMDEEEAQQLIEMLGTTDDIINNPQVRAKAEEEAEVLQAYNTQYEQFRDQTRDVFREGAVQTSTPGTTRRTVFNVLLEKLYGFDPRNRQGWEKIEQLVPSIGLVIHALRMLIEEKVVVEAIKEHREMTVIDL